MTCKTCRFYAPDSPKNPADEGQCRRRAPVVLQYPTKDEDGEWDLPDHAVWPHVIGEYHWCGQYETKEGR